MYIHFKGTSLSSTCFYLMQSHVTKREGASRKGVGVPGCGAGRGGRDGCCQTHLLIIPGLSPLLPALSSLRVLEEPQTIAQPIIPPPSSPGPSRLPSMDWWCWWELPQLSTDWERDAKPRANPNGADSFRSPRGSFVPASHRPPAVGRHSKPRSTGLGNGSSFYREGVDAQGKLPLRGNRLTEGVGATSPPSQLFL